MAATHQLAIAKASFSAGLLRPDPTSISKDEISNFHAYLDRVVSKCSPSNIQTCKTWLLQNTVSSSRITVLGKYLSALSASFADADTTQNGNTESKKLSSPSSRRRRLHILYLLNDILHHAKYHSSIQSGFTTFSSAIQGFLVNLFNSAASYEIDKYPKHYNKLDTLLDIWSQNHYYSPEYIGKLRETIKYGEKLQGSASDILDRDQGCDQGIANKAIAKDAPYVMPATHGDLSTPYYDLPAGNLMPHIIPNSTTPINPKLVKPLQFVAGPADKKLASAVQSLVSDMDNIYNPHHNFEDEGIVVEIDELGQPIFRDEDSGDIINGESYYGWSRSFCEKMKRRYGEGSPERSRVVRRTSSSYSSDYSKRRRYSDSMSSRSRSQSREPESSLSRSRSRISGPGFSRSGNRSNERSRSPRRRSSKSRSPRGFRNQDSRPRSRNRSASYTPPFNPPMAQLHGNIPTAYPPQPPGANIFPPGPPPNASSPVFHPSMGRGVFLPGGMPIPPPPPPPNYTGTWSPPPPPPNITGTQGHGQYSGPPGFIPPPLVGYQQNQMPFPNQGGPHPFPQTDPRFPQNTYPGGYSGLSYGRRGGYQGNNNNYDPRRMGGRGGWQR